MLPTTTHTGLAAPSPPIIRKTGPFPFLLKNVSFTKYLWFHVLRSELLKWSRRCSNHLSPGSTKFSATCFGTFGAPRSPPTGLPRINNGTYACDTSICKENAAKMTKSRVFMVKAKKRKTLSLPHHLFFGFGRSSSSLVFSKSMT